MNSMRLLALAGLTLLCTAALGCSGTDNSCPDGFVACSGVCTDLRTSRDSCGGCGESCSDGEVCSAGACATSCSIELTECSGSCRDTNNNPSHCGVCNNVCGLDEVCSNGSCSPSGNMCGAGTVDCSGACVDTNRDTQNCGDCAVVCGPSELCNAGNCEVSCGPGTELCGTLCAATQTDLNNCGGCGVVCGADESCVAGDCLLSCGGAAPTECNGVCTNLDLDPANCGDCATVCGANEVCNVGSCTGSGCPAPLTQCGQSCTSTASDIANCGGCGTFCAAAPASSAVCLDGSCAAVCATGFADCNADLDQMNSDGCEVDTVNNVGNCGSCGRVCDVLNAAARCAAGTCEVAQCSLGFDDCDANLGCETDVRNDDSNCGSCGFACPGSQVCVNEACIAGTGEDCGAALVLLPGTGTVAWMASNQDYFAAGVPSCVTFGAADGPDVVMSYQATVTGFATLSMQKPVNNRHFFVVSDAACGTVTPELACASEFTPTVMSDTFAISVGTTYTVYFSDHDSGAAPLPNPLDLTLTELDCNTANVAVLSVAPVDGSTTSVLNPSFSATFDGPLASAAGVVSITGSLGTSLSYDLALNPAELTLSAQDTTITVVAGINFPPGEVLTVSLTGFVGALCGTPVATVSWQTTIITPPCQPGVGQMVGSTVTAFATTSNLGTEYYIAADTSSVGWVYFGGTTELFRARKTGGNHEVLPVTSADLGYDMLVDGLNIYTLDSATTGTVGHVSRISDDGGASFFGVPQDMAGLPAVPGDDFRGIASFGGLVYIMTHEGTAANNTEVYAFDPSTAGPTTPAAATLVGTFSGEAGCSGLAVDASAYYTVCSTGERIIRVDRATAVVSLLSNAFDASGTANALHGRDIDQDSVFDFLYVQTWYREGYFVCDPSAATPFVGNLFVFGGGNLGNYGMGYDSVQNTLWMYNDTTDEIVSVQ